MDPDSKARSQRSRWPTRLLAGLAVLVTALGATLGVIAGTARPADAQSSSQPVPCEVAMVVGCIATVTGSDGTVSMTLRVSDTGGETVATTAIGNQTTGVSPIGEPEAEESVVGEPVAGEPEPGGLDLGQPEQNGRPLQSTVDPWEQGGLASNFGTQSIPISHYQIGADTTGWLGVPDPLDSFVASQTNWAFTTSTFMVILATNALDWAFEFPIGESLVGRAGVLAQSYTVDFFGFGLNTSVYGLALAVTMVVAGFKAMTKGLIAAGSEVVLSFAAYVILIVLTLSSGFGNAGLVISRLSSDLSGSIATFAAGNERQEACALELQVNRSSLAGAAAEANGDTSASATSSACSFGYAIQRSMVELPYQNLQWGQVLDGVDGKERCAAVNLELLSEGPWGNDDEPRDRMRSASECEENADFNHQATYIRLGIASANAVSAGAVTFLILVVAAMLLWQQIKLLFLTVTMPHALVMAILPGRSRQLAWRWIELLIGVVIRTVILSLGLVVWLSLFSLIVYEQLTFRGIFLSLFASVAMAASGFWGLYKLSGLSKRINTNPAATKLAAGAGVSEPGGETVRRPSGGGAEREPGGRRLVEGARSTMRTVSRRHLATAMGSSNTNSPGTDSSGPVSSSTIISTTRPSATGSSSTSRAGGGSAPLRVGQTNTAGGRTGPSTRSPVINRPQRLQGFVGGPGDHTQSGDKAPALGSAAPAKKDPVEIGAGRP
ncbi:MAG: hypothetical protein ACRBK7_10215 [Acidimicrobiales bacterium]